MSEHEPDYYGDCRACGSNHPWPCQYFYRDRDACRECLDIEYAMWDDRATNAPEVNINLVNHNTAGWRLSYSGQGIQRETYAPKSKEDAELYLKGRGIVDIRWEPCWATHCSEAYTATGARK